MQTMEDLEQELLETQNELERQDEEMANMKENWQKAQIAVAELKNRLKPILAHARKSNNLDYPRDVIQVPSPVLQSMDDLLDAVSDALNCPVTAKAHTSGGLPQGSQIRASQGTHNNYTALKSLILANAVYAGPNINKITGV